MIELSEIASTLGVNAILSTCCTSATINKWSLNKPINSNKINRLSDDDYTAVNYGYYIYSFSTAMEMIADLQDVSSDIWSYIERQPPFRLTDFEGYIHDASPLLSAHWLNKDTGKAGDTLKFCIDDDTATIVNRWQFYQNELTDYDYCFVIYPAASSGGGVWIYKIINKLDYDSSGRFALKIPSSLQDGNYTAVLCVTDATLALSEGATVYDREGDYVGNWCPFPQHTKLNFAVSSSGSGGGGDTPDYFTSIDFSYTAMDFTYNHDARLLDDLAFTVDVDLLTTATDTNYYDVTLTAYYDNAPFVVNLGTQSCTVDQSDTHKSLTFNYRDVIYPVDEAQLNEDIIEIRFAATISKSQSTTQRKEWTDNIDKIIK